MPSRTRHLALRRETLSVLTSAEMEAVAGGDSPTWHPSCMNNCISLDRCPSIPIRDCPIYINTSVTSILEGTA